MWFCKCGNIFKKIHITFSQIWSLVLFSSQSKHDSISIEGSNRIHAGIWSFRRSRAWNGQYQTSILFSSWGGTPLCYYHFYGICFNVCHNYLNFGENLIYLVPNFHAENRILGPSSNIRGGAWESEWTTSKRRRRRSRRGWSVAW